MKRRGDLIEAWTEYDVSDDADYPEWVDVRVYFRITYPGCAPSYSNLDGGDPGDGPEGVVDSVHTRYQHRQPDGTPARGYVPAPADIDAWARHPDREATLFQQALDRA